MTVTFLVILIGGQGLVMDYPCGKFGDCIFSRFGFIVQTNRHTDTTKRFTPATVVSVRNESWASSAIWSPLNHDCLLHCKLAKLILAFRVPGVFSLALLPSRPSCTKISSSLTSRSFIAASPCTLAAMFANAFITADETCLQTDRSAQYVLAIYTNAGCSGLVLTC